MGVNMLIIKHDGLPLAYITPESDNLKDVWIDKQLNGPCTLSFSLPLSSSKWQYITPQNVIECDGKDFIILNESAIEHTREGRTVWGTVQAEESWILLSKNFPSIPPAGTPVGELIVTILSSSAYTVLSKLLQNTDWTVGSVDSSDIHDLETEKLSTLANINEVQKIWGGYLVWDSFAHTVSLRSEDAWQPYTGFRIQYAKNEKSITRTTDCNITTRLYPFGKEDLNIANVNNGILYLENYQYTDQVLEDIMQYPDIDNQTELKNKAIEDLAKLSKPRVNYKVSIVDVRTLPGYEHEIFDIGHIVDIYDPELSPDGAHVRIIRYKYNVLQPWQCELEIGDPMETIESILADSSQTSDTVTNNKDKWDSAPENLNKLVNGQYVGGTFIDGTSVISPTIGGNNGKFIGTVTVGSGSPIVIDGVNKKISINSTNYIDTNGIHVDAAYIRGTLDASIVNVTNINASNITTGTLTGITLTGVTIYATGDMNVGKNIILYKDYGGIGGVLQFGPSNSAPKVATFGNTLAIVGYDGSGDVTVYGTLGSTHLRSNNIYTDYLYGSHNSDQIYIGSYGCRIDTTSGILRLQQSTSDYISIDSSGNVAIYAGGTVKHRFNSDGTKTGGSIVIDGVNLGMSPIDAPEILIADIMRNVSLIAGDNEILLDDKTAQALYDYSVFIENNNGVGVMSKQYDKFIVHSDIPKTVDILVVGRRVEHEDTRWIQMDNIQEGS
jgi:phage minor structural protein